MKKISFSYLCLLGVCSLTIGLMGNTFAQPENNVNNATASEQMPFGQTAEPPANNAAPDQSTETTVPEDQHETAPDQIQEEEPSAIPNGVEEKKPDAELPTANGQEEEKPNQIEEEQPTVSETVPVAEEEPHAIAPPDETQEQIPSYPVKPEQQGPGNGDPYQGKSFVPSITAPRDR